MAATVTTMTLMQYILCCTTVPWLAKYHPVRITGVELLLRWTAIQPVL